MSKKLADSFLETGNAFRKTCLASAILLNDLNYSLIVWKLSTPGYNITKAERKFLQEYLTND